jgi:predicted  nucleic acid-binding Zn-ribbon protein
MKKNLDRLSYRTLSEWYNVDRKLGVPVPSISQQENAMMTRDEYVQKLKTQLDQWNSEISKWEVKTKSAQTKMKGDYEKQLKVFRSRRDEAMQQLRQVQAASGEAWMDMMRGADEAWARLRDAFTKARSHFDKK